MIDFNKTLRSEKIVLCPLEFDDFHSMTDLTQDPGMWTYFTSDLSKSEHLQKWISEAISEKIEKKRLAFAIYDEKTSKLIGSTSLGNISERDKRIEIGWTWIAKAYQGKGYNALVKFILLQYCFDECGFERVEFKTDLLNIPARNAMKKMGIAEEGILRSHTLMTGNRRRDTIFYGVLRDEWEALKLKLSTTLILENS